MPSSVTAPRRAAEPHSVGFTLAGIMLCIAMVGLSAAWGLGVFLGRQQTILQSDDSGPRAAQTLLGRELSIPVSWFRDGPPKDKGFAGSIDLRLTLPLGRNGALTQIDVTLLPQSQVRPSASLLDGVYLHEFMPEELSGPAGLVGKPLTATEGFENETVWYDALSATPFVAKCIAPPDGQGPAQCLRTVALSGGIAAVYSFGADVLDNWKDFDADLKARLDSIGAS